MDACPDCAAHEKGLCLRHKLAAWRDQGGMQVSPAATPNQRNHKPPKVTDGANAWERGIATDDRGMPYLKADLSPIGVKEWQTLRPRYEARRKATVTTTPATSPKE